MRSYCTKKGQWPMEYQFFPKIFFVASLCSFICLQALYQLSGAVCKATWNGYPSYSLLTFISRFVIDFLSIRKVIIFSAIATDDRHPLRSRSIHQNAANCMTIRFHYTVGGLGVQAPCSTWVDAYSVSHDSRSMGGGLGKPPQHPLP